MFPLEDICSLSAQKKSNGRLLANRESLSGATEPVRSAVRCSGHPRCSASHNGRLRRPSEANQVVHGAALYMGLQWSAVFFQRAREAEARRALLFALRA